MENPPLLQHGREEQRCGSAAQRGGGRAWGKTAALPARPIMRALDIAAKRARAASAIARGGVGLRRTFGRLCAPAAGGPRMRGARRPRRSRGRRAHQRLHHLPLPPPSAAPDGARALARPGKVPRTAKVTAPPLFCSAEREHPGLGDAGGGRAKVYHLQGPSPDAPRPGSSAACRRAQLSSRSAQRASRWSCEAKSGHGSCGVAFASSTSWTRSCESGVPCSQPLPAF